MTPLCRLDEIPDPGSIRVELVFRGRPAQAMVVRKRGALRAYINSCPHVGAPLDFTKGQFLNLERTHILCANHGAQFRIEDGHCIAGPCKGKSLTPVAVEVRDGMVFASGE